MSTKTAAQTRTSADGGGRGKIDVHHHFLSDALVNAIGRERIAAQASTANIQLWNSRSRRRVPLSACWFMARRPGFQTRG
jgi:hypothetical protein